MIVLVRPQYGSYLATDFLGRHRLVISADSQRAVGISRVFNHAHPFRFGYKTFYLGAKGLAPFFPRIEVRRQLKHNPL